MRLYCVPAVASRFSSVIWLRCSLFWRSSFGLRMCSGQPLIVPARKISAFSSMTFFTRSSVEKLLSKMSIRILKPAYLPLTSCMATCTKQNIMAVLAASAGSASCWFGWYVYVLIRPFHCFLSLPSSGGSLSPPGAALTVAPFLACTSSVWLSDATKPLAVPTLSMPMSAQVATVRARARGSVCALMSQMRSASGACCHAATNPRSSTRAGRHLLPWNGPSPFHCIQWPERPVANVGGSGSMPWPCIIVLQPGMSSSPWCSRRECEERGPGPWPCVGGLSASSSRFVSTVSRRRWNGRPTPLLPAADPSSLE